MSISAIHHAALVLKARADLAAYTPASSAPAWLVALFDATVQDLGTLALLGPAGVSVATTDGRRLRVRPDPAAVYVSALADRLRGSSTRVAVGLPPAARHLPLLLASTAVMGDAIHRGLGGQAGQDGILVISPDLETRSRYCDLFVGTVPLNEAYPGSRMTANGSRILLGKAAGGRDDQGVCFFLPSLALPDRPAFHPSLVVLELRYARWPGRVADLAQWLGKWAPNAGVVAFYSLGDLDTPAALSQAGFADVPFDVSALATCATQTREPVVRQRESAVDWWLGDAPALLDREHEIVEIEQASALEEIFRGVRTLLDEHYGRESASLNRARWLLAALSQVPVPLEWYEQAAYALGRSTLRRMIDRLGSRGHLDSGLGATLQTLRILFQQAYQELERLNPRAEAWRRLLRQITSTGWEGKCLILVRDRTSERALQNWLELDALAGNPWLAQIDVRGYPNYAPVAAQRYDLALVNGVLPRRYRWAAFGALGTRVMFIAYPHETEVIERQLQYVYSDRATGERAERRRAALGRVLGCSLAVNGSRSEVAGPPLRLHRSRHDAATEAPKPRAATISITSLEDLAETYAAEQQTTKRATQEAEALAWSWEDSVDEDLVEAEADDEDTAPHRDDVRCLQVEVRSRRLGRGAIWLACDTPVELIRPGQSQDILKFLPRGLRVGDVLLRMDEGGRTGLFDRIVELAEGQPQLAYLAAYRRAWKAAIQQAAAKHRSGAVVDYVALLRAFRLAGATIETVVGVRFWVQDQVIGPESVASIAAVGKVSGSETLVRQALEFDRAFRRIRGIRQGIGRRLNHVIRQSFGRFQGDLPDLVEEDLDDRLLLPLDELLETIDLVEVQGIGERVEAVAPYQVGRFRPTS